MALVLLLISLFRVTSLTRAALFCAQLNLEFIYLSTQVTRTHRVPKWPVTPAECQLQCRVPEHVTLTVQDNGGQVRSSAAARRARGGRAADVRGAVRRGVA